MIITIEPGVGRFLRKNGLRWGKRDKLHSDRKGSDENVLLVDPSRAKTFPEAASFWEG